MNQMQKNFNILAYNPSNRPAMNSDMILSNHDQRRKRVSVNLDSQGINRVAVQSEIVDLDADPVMEPNLQPDRPIEIDFSAQSQNVSQQIHESISVEDQQQNQVPVTDDQSIGHQPQSAISWQLPVAPITDDQSIGRQPQSAISWQLPVTPVTDDQSIGRQPQSAISWQFPVATVTDDDQSIGRQPQSLTAQPEVQANVQSLINLDEDEPGLSSCIVEDPSQALPVEQAFILDEMFQNQASVYHPVVKSDEAILIDDGKKRSVKNKSESPIKTAPAPQATVQGYHNTINLDPVKPSAKPTLKPSKETEEQTKRLLSSIASCLQSGRNPMQSLRSAIAPNAQTNVTQETIEQYHARIKFTAIKAREETHSQKSTQYSDYSDPNPTIPSRSRGKKSQKEQQDKQKKGKKDRYDALRSFFHENNQLRAHGEKAKPRPRVYGKDYTNEEPEEEIDFPVFFMKKLFLSGKKPSGLRVESQIRRYLYLMDKQIQRTKELRDGRTGGKGPMPQLQWMHALRNPTIRNQKRVKKHNHLIRVENIGSFAARKHFLMTKSTSLPEEKKEDSSDSLDEEEIFELESKIDELDESQLQPQEQSKIKQRRKVKRDSKLDPPLPRFRSRVKGAEKTVVNLEKSKLAKGLFAWSDTKNWFPSVEMVDLKRDILANAHIGTEIENDIAEMETWITNQSDPRLSTTCKGLIEEGAMLTGSQPADKPVFFNVLLEVEGDEQFLLKYRVGEEDIVSQLSKEIQAADVDEFEHYRPKRVKTQDVERDEPVYSIQADSLEDSFLKTCDKAKVDVEMFDQSIDSAAVTKPQTPKDEPITLASVYSLDPCDKQFFDLANEVQIKTTQSFINKGQSPTDFQQVYAEAMQLYKTINKKAQDQLNSLRRACAEEMRDIEEVENNLKSKIHPQTHRLLYQEDCPFNDYYDSHADLKPENPIMDYDIDHQLICDKDEHSLYFSSKYHSRSTNTVRQIWLYEQLLRVMKTMFNQQIPVPGPPQLIYIDEYGNRIMDDIQYTWEDMVGLDAEKGCQICMINNTVHNFNPIMYCDECQSGVHARCFGEGLGEDIDAAFLCSHCTLRWGAKRRLDKAIVRYNKKQKIFQKKFPDRKQWIDQPEQKLMRREINSLQSKINRDQEQLDQKICYFCGLKRGFLKKDNPRSMSKGIWWHPFCVLTSSKFVLQDLEQMKYLKYVSKLPGDDNKDKQCSICKTESEGKCAVLEKCNECSERAHSMCAWLQGWHFEQSLNADWSKDQRFSDFPAAEVQDVSYRIAFKSQTMMTCKTCRPAVDPEANDHLAEMRATKLDQTQINQKMHDEKKEEEAKMAARIEQDSFN